MLGLNLDTNIIRSSRISLPEPHIIPAATAPSTNLALWIPFLPAHHAPHAHHLLPHRPLSSAASDPCTSITDSIVLTAPQPFVIHTRMVAEDEKAALNESVVTNEGAYFDRSSNSSVVVPWGLPCYRIEGGLAARETPE